MEAAASRSLLEGQRHTRRKRVSKAHDTMARCRTVLAHALCAAAALRVAAGDEAEGRRLRGALAAGDEAEGRRLRHGFLAHNFPKRPDYERCAVDGAASDEATLRKVGYFAQAAKESTLKYGPGATWFQEFWEPCLGCANYARVGPRGDGGKWVCDPEVLLASPTCLVLSVGSNNDFSYEEAIVDGYGCTVHVYDYTSDPPKDDKGGKIKFFRVGLAPADGGRMLSLGTMLDRLAAEREGAEAIELVKIDCDGCEVAALADAAALANLKDRVLEFNLETHFRLPTLGKGPRGDNADATMLARAKRMTKLWAALHQDADMVPFSKEPNIQYSRGDSVEYSFANKKIIGA